MSTAEELLRETKDLMAEIKKMVGELLEEEKRSHKARETFYRQTAEGVHRCAELLEKMDRRYEEIIAYAIERGSKHG